MDYHPIYWIFGGSCAGKKTYINHVRRIRRHYYPYWIEDGSKPLDSILQESKRHILIIRWQWSREHKLAQIAEAYPIVPQYIWTVKADEEVQYQRMVKREPEVLCTEETLYNESRSIYWLTLGLQICYGIPVRTIDVTSDDQSQWSIPDE